MHKRATTLEDLDGKNGETVCGPGSLCLGNVSLNCHLLETRKGKQTGVLRKLPTRAVGGGEANRRPRGRTSALLGLSAPSKLPVFCQPLGGDKRRKERRTERVTARDGGSKEVSRSSLLPIPRPGPRQKKNILGRARGNNKYDRAKKKGGRGESVAATKNHPNLLRGKRERLHTPGKLLDAP